MTSPKVSIIIPVYKVPLDYLRACLDSLVAQTMQECEFIVVSDGAPKAESSICEEYAKIDSRFKFFKQTHSGVSATRNYGIEHAQGEYITFVDADDWIKPKTCEATYDFAQKSNSDIVLFDYNPIGNSPYKQTYYGDASIELLQPKEIKTVLKETISLTNDKYVGAVSTMCKLSKRQLFIKNDIRFPIDIAIAEDRVVSHSLFKKAKRVSYLRKSFYTYNLNTNSCSKKFEPNILPFALKYLYTIKNTSSDYSRLIANAALHLYFASWEKCYLNKNNPDSLQNRVKNVFSIAHSQEFNDLISLASINSLPPIIKQEAWLLKKKIAFPFLFHMIKHIITSFFK